MGQGSGDKVPGGQGTYLGAPGRDSSSMKPRKRIRNLWPEGCIYNIAKQEGTQKGSFVNRILSFRFSKSLEFF